MSRKIGYVIIYIDDDSLALPYFYNDLISARMDSIWKIQWDKKIYFSKAIIIDNKVKVIYEKPTNIKGIK